MTSWQPVPAGTLLRGRYAVEGLLGRGGFGATYRALDRDRFDEPCALKELLPLQAENPKVRELFEREARILLALRHAGIPMLHAYFVEGNHYYLVQDFVPGETLAQSLERRGSFSEDAVVQVLQEALVILEYLHGRAPAVIHRDLKPANLIRATSGGLYLVDFGAVKEAVGVTTLSAESTVIGTSGYTPPEQLRGIVLPASDLYALGATAVHLLTGRPPAEWYDVLEGRWRVEGQLGVSAHVEGVLLKLLQEQLALRFRSAREVIVALRGEASPPRTREPSRMLDRRPQTRSRRRRVTTSSGIDTGREPQVAPLDKVICIERRQENSPNSHFNHAGEWLPRLIVWPEYELPETRPGIDSDELTQDQWSLVLVKTFEGFARELSLTYHAFVPATQGLWQNLFLGPSSERWGYEGEIQLDTDYIEASREPGRDAVTFMASVEIPDGEFLEDVAQADVLDRTNLLTGGNAIFELGKGEVVLQISFADHEDLFLRLLEQASRDYGYRLEMTPRHFISNWVIANHDADDPDWDRF